MSTEDPCEDKLAIPVALDFVPISCSVRLCQYHDNSVAPSISMGLKLSRQLNVKTLDGRSLNDIDWSIQVYGGPVTSERVQSREAIGILNYFPGRQNIDYNTNEGGSAWAHLETHAFSLLSSYVLSGRMPNSIRIHSEGGLRYSWEPDGSGSIWDVQKYPHAYIKQLEVSLGVIQNPDEDSPPQIHHPVTAADLENMGHSLSTLVGKKLEAISTRLGWVFVAACVIAVAVILRR